MKEILSAKDFHDWMKKHFTRKFTVFAHVAAGIFCAMLSNWHLELAMVLFAAFAWFEWWQAKVEGDMGHLDFWDGVFGLGVGAGILLILTVTGGLT